MKDVKISNIQLSMLIMGLIFGSTAIINPASGAEQDAWLAFLMAWVGGFFLIGAYVLIARLNPSKTLVEILKEQFGKVVGSVIALMYIWYFIHLSALVLRNFGEYVVSTNYTETPIIFVMVCFVLVVVYSVRNGLEIIARPPELFMPIVIFLAILISMSLIGRFEWNNFLPFLERGFKPVLQSTFSVLTFPFGETVVFLMIFPALNQKEKMFRTAFFSVALIGAVIFIIVIRDLLVLGPEMIMPGRITFPPAVSTELISENLQLETIISINFLIGGSIKISVCLYAAILGITQLFNLDDYKPLVLPVAAFVVALAIWVYDNMFEMLSWAAEVWPYYSIPFQFGIPFLLLLISFIKKKNQKRKLQSNKGTGNR